MSNSLRLPEAISNLSEIVDKIEIYNLARFCLPKFETEEFSWQKMPSMVSERRKLICDILLTKEQIEGILKTLGF
jgi:hypothetical protein